MGAQRHVAKQAAAARAALGSRGGRSRHVASVSFSVHLATWRLCRSQVRLERRERRGPGANLRHEEEASDPEGVRVGVAARFL
jgi:hypothetical protein